MYHQVYAVLSQAIVAVLLILRTYALYNCSKRMLAVLIGMYMGGAIQSLTAILTSKSPLNTHFPLGFKYSGCDLSLTDDQGFHLALAWSAMLWFDTIIFVLTFYKAIKLRHEMPGGLLVTMFRDDFSDMFRYVQIREMMQSDPSDAQSSDIRFGPFRHSRIRHSSLDNFPPAERITTKLPHSKPENSGIGPGQDPTIIQLYRRILKPATDENRTVATGTVYYAILVAVNMANITTFLAISSKIPLKGTATTLTNVLSVTLTSRLMLNLRDPSVQIRRRVDGTRYEGWSVGQFSSRMMSFRPPTTMHTDNYTMNDMRESAATSSSVTV
ncbi:hypothetical protein C8Q76DRAFT_743223 [Earliella scabrosa]|nr:hypothetical protein C8Q76DRAFT_743223 [Earliella scabrosa]